MSEWSNTKTIKDNDCDIACMTPGKRRVSKQRFYNDSDSETEDEGDSMVCNMNGQCWEDLPLSNYHSSRGMRIGHANVVVQSGSSQRSTTTQGGGLV